MTVSSAVTRNDYTATGGQTIFPYTFETFASSDLVVLQNGTILSEGSQYTVSGVGLDAGGDITLLSGATASDAISVYLDMDLTRTTDYQNSGDFLASEVNDDFDRAWLATKQQQNSIDRSLRLPDADSTLDMALPVLASRKGTVLAFDETTGLPVVGPTISDVSSIASITADIARLADIEDGTLATDAIQTTAAISTNVTTVAGISANVTTVAGNTANINTVAGNDANITTVAGVSAGVSTLAPISADITATASNAADISTVATNIVDVTNFADVYQGPSASDPTVRNDASALQTGDLYFNTTTNELRAYSGSAWTSTSGGSVSVTRFSGTGAQTAYTLPTTPSSENNTQVYIDGIYQQKDTYSVSGVTLTFSEAPPLDTDNIEVTTIEALALGATSSDLVSHVSTGTGAVATTVQAKLRESVNVKDFGAVGDGSTDDTNAFINAALVGGLIEIPTGTFIIKPETTGEIVIISNTVFMGAGKGVTNIVVSEASNPSTAKYGFKLLGVDNIGFVDLTLKSDASSQGIFNLGSLSAGGNYTPDDQGNLYGMRISQCDNLLFDNVSIEGFNATGVIFTNEDSVSVYNVNTTLINCDSRDNRETGFSLQACNGFEIIGGLHERNGLQVFDAVDSAGDPTSTVRTNTNYIDGGTGYGIVLGRLVSATKLKSKNGICTGVRTQRNVRHGIDLHSGVNISIVNCQSTDDLLSGYAIQDDGSSLDGSFGNIIITGGSITHTAYAENRGYLFDDATSGVERKDSTPILIANIQGKIISATINGTVITNWRYRQLTTYSATDVIMAMDLSSSKVLTVTGVTIIADDASFYPAKIAGMTAEQCIFTNNVIRYGTRGTFDRAAFRFSSTTYNTMFSNNIITQINTYSSGTTQVARPIFDKVTGGDLPTFVGNTIKQSTQGTLGPLWYSASANAQWAYNGILGINSGNTLDGEGYASVVDQNETFYISVTGAGNKNGTSAVNAFEAGSVAVLQLIFDQLPAVTDSKTLTIQFVNGSYTLVGTVTIPFDGWSLLGDASEFSSGTTKSVDMDNAAACDVNFVFPKYGRRSTMKGIQVRSANGLTVRDVNLCEYNVIENSGTGVGSDFGIYVETGEAFINSNYFTGGYAAIGGFENASIASRVNATTGTQSIYGLNVNGGTIMKNSTQPTGSTGAGLAQNGGVIR